MRVLMNSFFSKNPNYSFFVREYNIVSTNKKLLNTQLLKLKVNLVDHSVLNSDYRVVWFISNADLK